MLGSGLLSYQYSYIITTVFHVTGATIEEQIDDRC
jgi:hypothetical protein